MINILKLASSLRNLARAWTSVFLHFSLIVFKIETKEDEEENAHQINIKYLEIESSDLNKFGSWWSQDEAMMIWGFGLRTFSVSMLNISPIVCCGYLVWLINRHEMKQMKTHSDDVCPLWVPILPFCRELHFRNAQ